MIVYIYGILLIVLVALERFAALRGSKGDPPPWLLDKSLRVLFLAAFTAPLFLVLPQTLCFLVTLAYMPTFLDGSEQDGSRASPWVRSWRIWTMISYRLDIHLHVTEPLNPKDSFLIGMHPHGILPFGAMFGLMTDVAGARKRLPGIDFRVVAASLCFMIPIYRDVLLAGGVCDASRFNVRRLLSRKSGAVCVVPGGATEALYAGFGRNSLVLKKRRGFVRLAMQRGASLVPVYTFGENDTYELVDARHELLHRVQKKFQSIFGISLPLLTHVLPRKTAIHIVMGTPIPLEKQESPSRAQVDAVLDDYIVALTALFDEHKDTFAPHRIEDLTLRE